MPPGAAARPPGIDAEQWGVLSQGFETLDDATLQRLVPLDANVVIELRPALLRQHGLWRPLLEALPTEARRLYQRGVEAMGADPFVRLESVYVGLGFAEDGGDLNRVSIMSQSFGGLVTDVVRWGNQIEGDDAEEQTVRVEIVMSEPQSPVAQRAIIEDAKSNGGTVVPLGGGTSLLIESTALSILSSGGLMAATADIGSAANPVAYAADVAFRLLRRLNVARAEARRSRHTDDDLLLRVKGRDVLVDGKRVSFTIAARLHNQLTLALDIRLPGEAEFLGKVRSGLTKREAKEKMLRKIDHPRLKAVMALALDSLTTGGRDSQLTLQVQVPTHRIASILGGATFAAPAQAASLGGGLHADRVLGTKTLRPHALDPRRIAASVRTLGQGVEGLLFTQSSNPRSVEIARWLVQEGTLPTVAREVRGWLRWPRHVPIAFADCGRANAFYSPSEHTIVLCYELVDDLLQQMRHRVSENQLGAAVVGSTLFVLLHELGHAMVHELDLPVTGKEEDAVDQLAGLLLLARGEKGVGYAVAAQHWFSATRRSVTELAFWDEHSTNDQRFYGLSCLIYGSNPTRYAEWGGTDWLPTARARRCRSEYQQIHRAWNRLLTPHFRR